MPDQKDDGYSNFKKTQGTLEYLEKFSINKNETR